MALIRVKNTLPLSADKTLLSTKVSAGGTVLPVQNTNAFTGSWAIQIGDTGVEQSEVKVLAASIPAGGTALHLTAALTYDHPTDTPVYATKYDKVVFKRSTAGTAGTASAMTDGTVTITADSTHTQFDDTNSSSDYAYKAAFQSSGLAVNSDDSDWITSSGFSFYSLASIRQRAKDALFDSSFIGEDSVIDGWINEWGEKMYNEMVDINRDYALSTTSVSFGTNGLATVTASDFRELRRVWVTYNGTDYNPARQMNLNEFHPDQDFNDTYPYFYYYGDNVFGVKPSDTAGTAQIVYYNMYSPMGDDTDELPRPMRPYSATFVDYALYRAKIKDDKTQDSYTHRTDAKEGRDLFKNQVAPRHKADTSEVLLVAPISGEDW